MLFNQLKRICTIVPSLVSAIPLASSVSSLASFQALPTCAQACVSEVLRTSFPQSCVESGDLACLCSQYSTEGLTLGEISFVCVHSSCNTITLDSEATSAFAICLGQSNAVSATHSVVTVTIGAPITTSLLSTNIAAATTPTIVEQGTTSMRVTSSSVVPTSTLSTSLTANVASTVKSSISQEIRSSNARPSAAVATSPVSHPLKPAQIAGIAVAGAASVILALSVLFVLFCVKRRDKLEREQNEKVSFDIIHPPIPLPKDDVKDSKEGHGNVGAVPPSSYPPDKKSTPSTHDQEKQAYVPTRPASKFHRKSFRERASRRCTRQQTPQRGPEHEWSWAASIKPENIGIPFSPEVEHDGSPICATPASATSQRTLSKLLPDKPDHSCVPPPLRFSKRPDSEMTTFEEDRKFRKPALTTRVQSPPIVHIPSQNYNGVHPVITRNYISNPEVGQYPSLSLQIPARHSKQTLDSDPPSRGAFSPRQHLQPIPQVYSPSIYPMATNQTPRIKTPKARNRPESGDDYLPNYYLHDAGYLGSPAQTENLKKGLLKMESQSKLSRTASTNASRGTSVARSESCTSLTSFESTDPDEPTPPDEEENELSPVAESPISNLRYPKVPRSTSQAVPRSPKRAYTIDIQEGSSLLAKRRGDDTALELEKGLRIANSNLTRAATIDVLGKAEAKKARGHSRIGSDHALEQAYRSFHEEARNTHRFSIDHSDIDHTAWQGSHGHEMVMKSPLWAPKLTPTRRGNDLYLSVS